MQNRELPIEEAGIDIHVSLDDDTLMMFSMEYDGCPICGQNLLARNGRCTTCEICGWSACDL